MVPRIAAVVLGLIAGIAAILVLALNWDAAVAWLGVGKPNLVAALGSPLTRLAWIIAVSASVFAAVALLIALAAGFVETLVARARIDALRHDPGMVGRWNAADWRAAFAHTAVSDRAEAIVAALLPASLFGSGPSERRVFADPSLLVDLGRIWLDRMTLGQTITPLPALLLGVGGAAALFRYASGESGWEMALAAGVSGWLFIRAAHYLVRLILGPAVELAVSAATAAVRPLTSALSLELIAQHREAPAALPAPAAVLVEPPRDTGTAVVGIGESLSQQLERLASAADRMSSAGSGLAGQLSEQIAAIAARAGEAGGAAAAQPLAAIADGIRNAVQQREQAIEAALAQVRAGIEELLAAPPPAHAANGTGEATHQALVDQGEAMRQAALDLRGGVETMAGSLQATLASIEATERQNAALLADLAHAIKTIGPVRGGASAAGAGSEAHSASFTAPQVPGEANSAVADALRNLLREFDET